MIVIDDSQEERSGSLLQLQLNDFRELVAELAEIELTEANSIRRARVLAEAACDASRQIVFRLHRSSSIKINQLCLAFSDAACVIEQWDLAVFSDDEQLVRDYGKHVKQRAVRLRAYTMRDSSLDLTDERFSTGQ